MPTKLVIVESPAKARTIAGFLGSGFVVESSVGHVRDLPRRAEEVPAAYKQEPWARLGVDTENDFKPLYVVPKEKKAQIAKLRKLVAGADELYLATDEDREGESIAWHLLELLSPKVPVRRMVFHEITAAAITEALEHTRDVDLRLVDAQEARRILDRLFGYELSPVLWKMVRPRLSAGRVQSPAIRILVDRERERMSFRTASYWDVEAVLTAPSEPGTRFTATLVALDGSRLVTGRDFDETGGRSSDGGGLTLLDRDGAQAVVTDLAGATFTVRSVERRPYRRSPYPPFRTSTLQQEAGRKLRFTAQRTMQTAQRLYENGYITYMRTDSTELSETAVAAARAEATARYGADYVPASPRVYRSKVRNAQEAHEAIRPAGDRFRSPEGVAGAVDGDAARLYDLIWKRTVASQMADAVGESVAVRLGATGASGRDAEFATSGKVISFAGFLRAYVEGSDDPDAVLEDQERRLPPLTQGDPVQAESLEARGHETRPPGRYTEAALVRRLEDLGIGRPSTYASIIQTIQDRGYVFKKGTALVPSFTAFAVVTLLERHFAGLVDYAFTARMEDDLDRIASGTEEMVPWLSRFYEGNGSPGLKRAVSEGLGEIDAREINSIPIGEDGRGRPVLARVGQYGPYLQCGDASVSLPDDLPPDELTLERALELLEAPNGDRELGIDPATGEVVIVRSGRYGPYVQLGGAEGDAKPKTASLFKDMELETVTLQDALGLLSLPRVVGADPETGEDITAQNGRYGPYLKRGKETRSLDSEEQIFTIGLDEAVRRFAAPKRRGAQSAAPIREVGTDPATGCAVVVKDGRFGPYVTDGAVNASLRKGDSVDTITIDRAAELLAARRARLEAEGKPVPPCPPARGEPSSGT